MEKLFALLLFFCVIPHFSQSQSKVKLLPTVTKEEFEAGAVPGDNTQHMLDFSYCESDPDRIYMAQDVGSVWVSKDAGRNWYTLSNYGLYTPFIISVEVDPLDKNRVLAAGQCRHYDATNHDYQGIYLSKDGGITWERKEIRKELGEVRSSTKLLAYAPSSKNTRLGYATRWYAAFSEYKALLSGRSDAADDGLVYSDDGGESWTEVRKLPAETFGEMIRGVRVDPADENRVYIYGTKGLFRFNEAICPNGLYERLSGKNGLPEGDIYGRLYISKDGQTLIVSVCKDGIYQSMDGGLSWKELYDWNQVRYCFVNEGYPEYIYAVPLLKSELQLRFSTDGGKTWNTNVNVRPRPGYPRTNWWTGINGDFTCMIPDIRNPERVFAHSNSWHSQTDDGGFNWYPSDNGYNGSQHIGLNSQQMFDLINPDRFCYFMVDKGVYYTDTRGRWFYPNTIVPKKDGLIHKTIKGGALLPDSIILASAGTGVSGQIIRSTDNGRTWTKVSTTGNRPRWVVAYDPDSSNYCYQWRERSADHGATWRELPNMPANTVICGMAPSDGRVLYAMDVDGTETKIWRSADRGDNWDLVITAGWNLTWIGPDRQFTFLVHPKNSNIVFTNSADGQISKWDLDNNTRADFDVTHGGTLEKDFFGIHFAIDPRYPAVMYLINRRVNTGNKLFRTQDGGNTWENISDGFPNAAIGGLAVSPVTGEVYFSSQNGSRVMLPPYETSNTAYELSQYKNNHLDK
ncbi:MAG: hypothetical protein AAGU19_04160 [Prolixibacteraceae bacterium]